METYIILLRAAICLVSGAAVIELLAALFSMRVRRYIAQRPIVHLVWFACALFLAFFMNPAYSTRHGGF